MKTETRKSGALCAGDYYKVLKRRGWAYTDFGDIHYIEGVGFTHVPLNRMGRPFGGKNAESTIGNESKSDIVYGHSHIRGTKTIPKIGKQQNITVLNLGCALPNGHIESYAKHSMTGWTYGAYELLLSKGRILADKFHCMEELEDRYG